MKMWLKILIIVVLVLGVVGGAAGLIVGIDKGKFDSKNIPSLAFSVGGLDSTGKYTNTDASIYTKDAFECQGLNVTLDFDTQVTYSIYFYDQNKDFVHTTGSLSTSFVKDSVPFFAKYARVVATPKEDQKVSLLEVYKYAKNVNISVYREQGYKNYTENLFGTPINCYGLSTNDGSLITTGETALVASDYINVSVYKSSLIFRENSSSSVSSFLVYLYGKNKTFLGYNTVASLAEEIFTSSEGIVYYSIPLTNMMATGSTTVLDVQYIRMCATTVFGIYCK